MNYFLDYPEYVWPGAESSKPRFLRGTLGIRGLRRLSPGHTPHASFGWLVCKAYRWDDAHAEEPKTAQDLSLLMRPYLVSQKLLFRFLF
jgi:hypothetical protein